MSEKRIRTIGNSADFGTAGRQYFVTLERGDEEVRIAVRRLSVSACERIDADIPEPWPPTAYRDSGEKFLDTTDQDYRLRVAECTRKRRERRILDALGRAFFPAGVSADERLRILREDLEMTPADLLEIDAQLRSPHELVPAMVAEAEQRLSPTGDTPTDQASG